jgi:hypothetical protein
MKKILFTEPLFCAVANGTKTQTRRILKPQPHFYVTCYKDEIPQRKVYLRYQKHENGVSIKNHSEGCLPCTSDNMPIKPRYKIGETVYFAEPEKHARYFIKITAVSCEQLQDISDEDCKKEGVEEQRWEDGDGFFSAAPCDVSPIFKSVREAYAYLIDSIYGEGTWRKNPFVWVYEFELVKI